MLLAGETSEEAHVVKLGSAVIRKDQSEGEGGERKGEASPTATDFVAYDHFGENALYLDSSVHEYTVVASARLVTVSLRRTSWCSEALMG